MTDTSSLANVISRLRISAPVWLLPIRDALLHRRAELTVENDQRLESDLIHPDEKEQVRYLELALKNAAERGLARFHTDDERDKYRRILAMLSDSGPQVEDLRREMLDIFILSANSNDDTFTESFNSSPSLRLLTQQPMSQNGEMQLYVKSFFEAFHIELSFIPWFRLQVKEVLKSPKALATQRSLTEIIATTKQIGEPLAQNYTPEHFEQDTSSYATYMELILHNLKLRGVVIPKDYGHENMDPEISGIFVPLRFALQGRVLSKHKAPNLINLLKESPCLVLLGGPGSGKSTAIRHLAWSHAESNLSSSSDPLASTNLLPGVPSR